MATGRRKHHELTERRAPGMCGIAGAQATEPHGSRDRRRFYCSRRRG